ncbi:MAG: hypothetical protein ACUZ77_12015 [Candidatus Brocadiales bacterium]
MPTWRDITHNSVTRNLSYYIHKLTLSLLLILSIVLSFAQLALAVDLNYNTIDFPGANETYADQINDAGQIIGEYEVFVGADQDGTFNTFEYHSFLRDADGSFSTIDFPGADETYANQINDAGQIVGVYYIYDLDQDGTFNPFEFHGFLRDADGSFSTIDFPGADRTSAHQINDAGQIVGVYYIYDPDQDGTFNPSAFEPHGFLRDADGSFSTIDFPGADETYADQINDAGQIIGEYIVFVDTDQDGTFNTWEFHSFLRDADGSLSTMDFPGANETYADQINDAGQIIGEYEVFDDWHSFLRDADGSFSTIDFPVGDWTYAYQINDAGQIVGRYIFDADQDGTFNPFEFHGFLQDADGSFSTIDFPGAYRTSATRINSAGQIIGRYFLDNNQHSFVATPVLEVCDNGIDDDEDGLIDCNDPDCNCNLACAPPTETDCTNGVDDDCDGLVDCADPDCCNDPGFCPAGCTADVEVECLSPNNASPGQVVDLLVRDRNLGGEDADNVVVTVQLPPQLQFISSTGGGSYNGATHQVTWDLGTLPPGNIGYLTVKVSVQWGLLGGILLQPDFTIATTSTETDTLNNEDSCTILITAAQDPNIKFGPGGAVLAGQQLDYSVEFENEGEGIAFGVNFTDTLDEDLDDSTLVIGPVFQIIDNIKGPEIAPPGTYDPATRTITWLVGEVGPGEGGIADFSVNVRGDAPMGTEIINFGVVNFPSVPEVTPTNAIVSVIPLTEICDNGIDDDGNGLADCADPVCFGTGCPEVCDDDLDNDGDGFVDCADTTTADCLPCPEICDDNLDNDGDELVDCNDPDCASDPACLPLTETNCTNGADDDGDGRVDCADPDCVTSTTYSKGKSFIRFKHNKTSKDKAYLRMCIPKAFCDIIKAGPAAKETVKVKEIVLTLGGCSSMIIPGSSLKPTKFGFRAKSAPGETPKYVVKINCKREWLKIRLKKLELKGCISNPVKACVSITGIPCLCAEKEFNNVTRDKVGRLKKLLLRDTEVCSPR